MTDYVQTSSCRGVPKKKTHADRTISLTLLLYRQSATNTGLALTADSFGFFNWRDSNNL